MRIILALMLAAPLLTLPLTGTVTAQQQQPPEATQPAQEEKPAPYDTELARLAELIGAIHYLRGLCGEEAGEWRDLMGRLLEAETGGEPRRRARLTAAFNRGYRSFAATHIACSDAARTAEGRYRAEGATLAGEITARYGN